MSASYPAFLSTLPGAWGRALMAALLVALAACSGTAVVTMTSTASTDNFLAYRVALVSVQLQSSGGGAGLTVLPASTTVDFATLTNLSEVLGATPISKGNYTSAVITLDYSAAQIVYDNGSVDGLTLTPVGTNGQPLAQVRLTVTLDPSDSFSISSKGASQLSLDFNLAASNVVDLANNTVTVTPLIAASAMPIDSKQVRIRGALASVSNTGTTDTTDTGTTDTGATTDTGTVDTGDAEGLFTSNVMPFNSITKGTGALAIVPTGSTYYEINGSVSSGSTGLAQLGALNTGALTVSYGTLVAADQAVTTTTDGITSSTSTGGSSTVTFSVTQVLAGSSVQGSGLDRVSGVVLARSGDTLSIEDGTVIADDGTVSFIPGTTTVIMGANTLITALGANGTALNSLQQVSVGSVIDAFGVITSQASTSAVLDASAGRVRLDPVTASGLVVANYSDTADSTTGLGLNLVFLDGRAIAPFDFTDSGVVVNPYVVDTPNLDLTYSTVGAPVIATGMTGSFGLAPLDFSATSLLDPTTIDAILAIDWGSGTASPFVVYNSAAITVDAKNTSIGTRHQIQIGAQPIDIVASSTNPIIEPSQTTSNTVYTIGHSVKSTTENFNTYAAFIAQLQTELKGGTLATGMTAVGPYTTASYTLNATSITVFLNN
jgi:hypothetical protein